MTHIEILHVDNCPGYARTRELVREVAQALGCEVEIRDVRVRTPGDARRLKFPGSPTVRVNGRDIQSERDAERRYGLTCRLYEGRGVPSHALIEDALRRTVQKP